MTNYRLKINEHVSHRENNDCFCSGEEDTRQKCERATKGQQTTQQSRVFGGVKRQSARVQNRSIRTDDAQWSVN